MDEFDFTLDGEQFHLTRDLVIRSMRNQIPGRIQTYAVEIEGVRFPVKQVLAQALQIKASRFVSTRAQDLLEKLDFDVIDVEREGPDGLAASSTARYQALGLAVQFLVSRPEPDSGAVLPLARSFARWIAQGEDINP